jgi:hypothetical protein
MGKHGKKLTSLLGRRFGRLLVIASVINAEGRTAWRTKCDCGNIKTATTGVLNNGSTQSCGCYSKEVAAEVCRELGKSQLGKPAKHGHYTNKHRSPEYQSWSAMRDRCERKTHSAYRHYGGRGITICPQWRDEYGFETFLRDMSSRPQGMTLDRIDVNGNYEPGNCRWATPKTQALNRRAFRALANFSNEDILAEVQRRGL